MNQNETEREPTDRRTEATRHGSTPMSEANDADDTAHDSDESTNEQTETVEIDLAPADVERIELEIEESDAPHAAETVEDWIAKRVRLEFSRIDNEAEYHTATPEVEVPPLVAERARLEYESARQRGKDRSIDEMLFNNVMLDPEWHVDGEPFLDDETSDE